MATYGYTFQSGDGVTPTRLNDARTISNIVDADISASAAIAGSKLADGAVATAKIADSAVTTAKINDSAVTAAKLDGAQTGSAPIYGCRAWALFDGTKDATGAASTANTNRQILAGGNVSSVTRTALGTYVVNFTTAMPDANFASIVDCSAVSGAARNIGSGSVSRASGSLTVAVETSDGAALDVDGVSVCVFR